MFFEEKSKIVMIGDSITDCGRTIPVANNMEQLGNGYVNIVAGHLNSAYPQHQLCILNMGISGNTVRDLKMRWEEDVCAHRPDYITIAIGINDATRYFSRPFLPDMLVDINEYGSTLNELVTASLPRVKGVVLISPFFLEKNKDDEIRQSMDEYRAVMKKTAAETGSLYVDIQEAFDEMLLQCNTAFLSRDRVHPNVIGHTIIAKRILKAVGYQW